MYEFQPSRGGLIGLLFISLYPTYYIWNNRFIGGFVLYDSRDAVFFLALFKVVYSPVVAFFLIHFFQGYDQAISFIVGDPGAFAVLILSYAWMSFIIYSIIDEGNYRLGRLLFMLFSLPILDAAIIGLAQLS